MEGRTRCALAGSNAGRGAQRLVGLRGLVRIALLLKADDLAAGDAEDVASLVAVLGTGCPLHHVG